MDQQLKVTPSLTKNGKTVQCHLGNLDRRAADLYS